MAGKVMALLLALGQVGLEIERKVEAAKAATSDGGASVTKTEVLAIVRSEIGPVIDAFAGLFA